METKIQLSAPEMNLMCDAGIILTKNAILQKIKLLLEEVQQEMQLFKNPMLPAGDLFTIPPKISKGEYYLGLPYLILDYPRIFTGTDIFAIRTMFWWGHFFSSTLHLAGSYKQQAATNLAAAYPYFKKAHYINVHANPWHHHFEEDNYVPIAGLQHEEFKKLLQQPHIKIAAKWPLTQWHHAATNLYQNWENMLGICFNFHQSGEKDLSPDDPTTGSGL